MYYAKHTLSHTSIHTHTMEYDSTLKKRNSATCDRWIYLKDIILREICLAQRDKDCMISLMCRIKQSYSREENDNFHGLRGRGKREILVKGIKFSYAT